MIEEKDLYVELYAQVLFLFLVFIILVIIEKTVNIITQKKNVSPNVVNVSIVNTLNTITGAMNHFLNNQ